jgi:hypothetical protein
MNASGPFAIMLSKGNKLQPSHSALARIRPAAKNLVGNVRGFKADNEEEPKKLLDLLR